jgi:hypothetical protein
MNYMYTSTVYITGPMITFVYKQFCSCSMDEEIVATIWQLEFFCTPLLY